MFLSHAHSVYLSARLLYLHISPLLDPRQCRLCGHLFCSQCTNKYHVPSEFNLKNKPGPSRVCYGCRDQCLDRRQQFMTSKGVYGPSLRTSCTMSYSKWLLLLRF